ncbi:nitroreductase [Paracoccus aestuarii]|nr:nitroreductase [Paracoccus aestuarii]
MLDAITSRRAIRGFRPTDVAPETIRRILAAAGRAPSGSNIQPWFVDVVTDLALARLTSHITALFDAGERGTKSYPYYPDTWREPYLGRRRKLGWDLYGMLGIKRHEKEKLAAQHRRNFLFFDAPVGLILSIERDMGIGSWLDSGMFAQNIMIAARAFGLHTCPIQALAAWEPQIIEELGLPENRRVVCGMALGEADPDMPANALETERMALEDFARFHDK